MGLLKDVINVASKVADKIDDVVEATGVKGVVADAADYVDDTFDEIKEVISGDKKEDKE